MHTVSHRLITANLRTTPGRKNFKIVKQLSDGKKKEEGSKIMEEATINFNVTQMSRYVCQIFNIPDFVTYFA